MASRDTGFVSDIDEDSPEDILGGDTIADTVDIALTIDDDRWAAVLGASPSELVFPAVTAALAMGAARTGGADASRDICLGLTFTDDAAVRTLNRDYRGRDSATNVLSFAFQDGEALPQPDGAPIELGDLVLAYETILHESHLQARPIHHHLLHLIVHGVLHLLGYDHMTDDEAAEMESLEIEILKRFSIPDPYRSDSETATDPDPATRPTPYEEDTPAASRADGLP